MKKTILVFLNLSITFVLSAQVDTLSKEQIHSLIKLSAYNETWSMFLNVWAILGPLLGCLITYFGLKGRMEKWAESEITKKASEQFGVDWSIVNKLVVERKTLLEKRGQCKNF